MKNYMLCLILFLTILSASAQQQTVAFDNNLIRYSGRMNYTGDAAVLSWPGNAAKISFKGNSVWVTLKDQDTSNYYQIVIDRKPAGKLHPDTTKKVYLLADNLSGNTHTAEIFKRTEWDKGKTLFYGFSLPKEASVLQLEKLPKRKIEFYGNSITCGYATEDFKGDSPIGYYENNYDSYAAITARHFNAQYSCIAKSGIGVLVSWFPLIMPEMYNRQDATDSASRWNFNKYTPDLVVINLFQNDSWITQQPDNPEFKHRFGTKAPSPEEIIAAYHSFLQKIRNVYPKAAIICTLGSMDATKIGSPWPGYVKKAVLQMQDKKIYTHFFPYKNTPGHPKLPEQRQMATDLISFIDQTIRW